MTITITPAWDDVSIAGGRSEHTFLIEQTSGALLSHTEAFDALMDESTGAPMTDGVLHRSNRPGLRRITNSMYLGRVEYGPTSPLITPTGSFEVNIDISGRSQRIYQSLETVNTYAAPGKTAPNFKGAINVTRDGVQGAEIIVPEFVYTRTWYVADATVTTAWIRDRARLVGTVSSTTLFGWPVGEMLMTGFSGNARPQEDDWAITMRWGVRENLTGLAVGEITGIDLQGWDFLWTHHVDEEDATAKMVVRRAISAYVERVYRRANHDALLP